MTPYDLRQGICDFCETNPKLIDDMSFEDMIKYDSNSSTELSLQDYVRNMRNTSTMGGAIEIKAFCVLFKRNAKIYSVPNNKIIEFIVNEKYPYITLRWTGGHYDPM